MFLLHEGLFFKISPTPEFKFYFFFQCIVSYFKRMSIWFAIRGMWTGERSPPLLGAFTRVKTWISWFVLPVFVTVTKSDLFQVRLHQQNRKTTRWMYFGSTIFAFKCIACSEGSVSTFSFHILRPECETFFLFKSSKVT